MKILQNLHLQMTSLSHLNFNYLTVPLKDHELGTLSISKIHTVKYADIPPDRLISDSRIKIHRRAKVRANRRKITITSTPIMMLTVSYDY